MTDTVEYIEKIQDKMNKSIEVIPNTIDYDVVVGSVVEPLVKRLQSTKDFPSIDRNSNAFIDVYVEACTRILIDEYVENINNYEYSLFKDSVLSLHAIINVLEEHPYLINLIHRNITVKEWDDYRKQIMDEINATRDEHMKKSELELLCTIEDEMKETPSVIHNFNYLMGASFAEDAVSISYKEMLEKVGDSGILVLHISRRVLKEAVVIYKQIEKINKELILNVDKVKRLRPITYPDNIYDFKKDYEVINPKSKGFNIALCYDNGDTLEKCTYSVAKFGYPMTFLKRYLDGAVPRTLSLQDVKIYLQEWLFEKFEDVHDTEEDLARFVFTLQHIAQDNYDDNVETCIRNILKDERIKTLMPTEKERGIFYTYVHGLKILSSTRMGDVVDYIKSYVGDVF